MIGSNRNKRDRQIQALKWLMAALLVNSFLLVSEYSFGLENLINTIKTNVSFSQTIVHTDEEPEPTPAPGTTTTPTTVPGPNVNSPSGGGGSVSLPPAQQKPAAEKKPSVGTDTPAEKPIDIKPPLKEEDQIAELPPSLPEVPTRTPAQTPPETGGRSGGSAVPVFPTENPQGISIEKPAEEALQNNEIEQQRPVAAEPNVIMQFFAEVKESITFVILLITQVALIMATLMRLITILI
jgi:hypothetical protein